LVKRGRIAMAAHSNGSAMIQLDSHDSLVEQFSKWVYEFSRNGSIVTKSNALKKIKSLTGAETFEKDVTQWISKARKYAHRNLLQYIMYVPGEGWRIAKTSDERINYCAKKVRTVCKHMDSGLDTINVLTKDEFGQLAKRLRDTRQIKKSLDDTKPARLSYEDGIVNYLEQQTERMKENEQKQIAEK
jgi:hypothetical protein